MDRHSIRYHFSSIKAIASVVGLICIGQLYSGAAMATGSVLPITNVDNQANHELSRQALRSIYSMRTQSWPDGQRLVVFVLEDDADLHSDFCQTILGVLPYQLRRSWDRLIFSGRASAPIVVANVEEMKRRVAETNGSLGYLSANQIDDSIAVVGVK